MRVLIYGINYAPEVTGVGKYTGEMAEWLAANGHDIRVITAPPYYPVGKVSPEYQNWQYTHEYINGVEVFRCPLWVKERPSSVERLLHLFSFAISSFLVALKQVAWKPDVVLVIEPAFFCVPGALLTASLSGAYAWLHIQDLEVDAAFEMEAWPKARFIKHFAFTIERWLIGRFDRVSGASEKIVECCKLKGINSERIVLFQNWVDCNFIYPINPIAQPNSLREMIGISEFEKIVLYSGNMDINQRLDILLEAAKKLNYIHFVFCGNVADCHRIENEAKYLSLCNVHFLPSPSIKRLNELLNIADIHAFIQCDNPSDLGMPSNLMAMLASGRPIVAITRLKTVIANLIQDSNCGRIISPEEPEMLVIALQELISNPELCQKLGNNSRQFACSFSPLEKESTLIRFMNELKVASMSW